MTVDLAADQDLFFTDFAETGKLITKDGYTRDASLLIYRQQPDASGDGGLRTRTYQIRVKNTQTGGLTADEILQGDGGCVAKVTFPESVGDKAFDHITRPINRIVNQNAGMLLVEVML